MPRTNRAKLKKLKEEISQLENRVNDVQKKVQANQDHLNEISQLRNRSKEWAQEIEAAKNKAKKEQDEIQGLQKEISRTKEELGEKLKATQVKKDEIDKFFIKIFGEDDGNGKRSGGLSERLNQKETEADNFLAEQEKKYKQLFERIESLLPGATSVGLAQAYHEQKESYAPSLKLWGILFFCALIAIFLTGVITFGDAGLGVGFGDLSDLRQSISRIIARAPFYLALIYLASFSSKQYRQNKRLEQEYVHKEVVARSYIGYKQELEFQKATEGDKSVLARLQGVLVDVIGENPSEIMDHGRSDDTPSFWKVLLSRNKRGEK